MTTPQAPSVRELVQRHSRLYTVVTSTSHRQLALQGKNVDEFDHVKHDRMLEAEDLGKDAAEELSSIKKEGMSEDMQRMMLKLQTPDAAKVATFKLFAMESREGFGFKYKD